MNYYEKIARFRDSRFSRGFRQALDWQPLSLRGFLTAVLGTVAIRVFALAEYDLVADVLGTAALGTLSLAVLSVIFFRVIIAARLGAEAHFEGLQPLSKKPLHAAILVHGSSIPPFFALRIEREFKHRGVKTDTHLLRGKMTSEATRYLSDEIIFPHRGFWEMEGLRCRIEDTLGLTRLTWRIPMHTGIEVGTEDIAIEPLPIVASSARSGDELSLSRDRSGDLFDIKAYDPSDGVKRILWKTYAKSGHVVVRRPEPAVIPEGELALFLVAKKEEDYVAGALQSYLQQLGQNQIAVLFGTDGLRESGLESSQGYLNRPEDIHRAINRCAWSSQAGTAQGFPDFISSLESGQRFPRNVVVFGAANGTWTGEVSVVAERAGIKLHLAAVPEEIDPERSFRQFARDQKMRLFVKGFPLLIQRQALKRLEKARVKRRASSFGSAAQAALRTGTEFYVVQGRGGFDSRQ